MVEVLKTLAIEQGTEPGRKFPMQVRDIQGDEPLFARWVYKDETIVVVDVIGERLASPPVDLSRFFFGHLLVPHPERFPKGPDVGIRPGEQRPVDAKTALVGR